MKKFILSLFILICTSSSLQAATKIRLGWQVPWTIQGQIVQILKHTDIAKKNGLEIEFIGRTFGPELNELGVAGSLDIILTADQPAAILFAKSGKWKGIGRLMYNRTSTYVPPKSSIQSLEDIKGKNIGVPFGAAAERVVRNAITEKSISNVNFTNLGMLEHMPLIKRADKNASTWGQFDALSGFDPIPAILEADQLVRTIHSGKVCSMILASDAFLEMNPKAATSLLAAVKEAYAYYKKNKSQANKWFMEEAKLEGASDKTFELTESLEPNFTSKEIRISFTSEDFSLMQEGADFATKTLGKKIDMKKFVLNKYIPKNNERYSY